MNGPVPKFVAKDLLLKMQEAKSFADIEAAVSDTLREAFNEVSAAAWRDALETFASAMEDGMHKADAAGIPAKDCGVEVTDVIMLARAMAADPKQVGPRAGRAKGAK